MECSTLSVVGDNHNVKSNGLTLGLPTSAPLNCGKGGKVLIVERGKSKREYNIWHCGVKENWKSTDEREIKKKAKEVRICQ